VSPWSGTCRSPDQGPERLDAHEELTPLSLVGARLPRIEDLRFLTGGGTYTADVVDERLAGACHVFFVRSPVAHARIVSIDATAACAAPGVVAVVTGSHLAHLPAVTSATPNADRRMRRPILATDRVRFVGEPVAAVVTDQPCQGADAAELVVVEYDPLPPVVSIEAALAGDVLLFEEAGTNVTATFGEPSALDPHLFDGCDVVVSATITNQRVAPAPLEARAAAVVCGPDGRLTAWIPNQGAQHTRARLAEMLGLDPGRIRVITPDVGGAFGAKFGADPEHAVVAWVARTLGRPARWTEARHENLTAMTHGRAQRQTITIGGGWDGTVRAYRLEVLQDAGAYPAIGAELPRQTILMAPGPYAFPRAEAIARSVVTTTTPVSAYRGAGRPEATAAVERAMDLFAAEIGMDPAEVRMRNLLPPFTEPHRTAFGAVYDTGDYATALDKVLAAANYDALRAERARRRARGDTVALGIGLSCYVEITGMGGEGRKPEENAAVEVRPDGSADIATGTSPHGQGHETSWAMLASEELGIPVERITVRWGDTDVIPRGSGTTGSRSLQQGGMAVRQAAQELIEMARERAADVLEADPSDLVFDVGRSAFGVRGAPHTEVSLARLARDEPLLVRTVFRAPGATFPFGAHLAVVEVDIETGEVLLRRIVTVDDAGTVLNPLIAEGQRHGGIAQGAAQALSEEFVYDVDGNPLTATLADYPLMSAATLPNFELVDMQTPTGYNSLGAKGIGESGTIGATPAVQNAVIDALAHLGVRHIDLPTSPYRVWRALRAVRTD
jgi:carbon-monoxide dehydrogenase large subunit